MNHNRGDLMRIATHAMLERGLEPEFSTRVQQRSWPALRARQMSLIAILPPLFATCVICCGAP